jgi:hypothetical protein
MPSKQIQIILAGMDGFVTNIVKKLVLDIVANLQAAPSEGGTPVDTGWARANWIPTVGTASGRPAPRPIDRGVATTAAANVFAEGEAAVAAIVTTYRASMGPVTIANNVPYILKLDAGSSKQAPSGFVRRAIVKALVVDLKGVRP